jgi:serine/threonine protein kinase
MNEQKIRSLLKSFGMPADFSEWQPYGHGHINDTYLLKTPGNRLDLILQRKNHLIFKNIEGMMSNIVLATNHVRKKLIANGTSDIDRKVMTYLSDPANRYFVQDDEGNYWTLFLFVKDSYSVEEVKNPSQAFSAGSAFGHFQNQLSDLDGSLLIDTIPNFHNGKFRYSQFTDSISSDIAGRVSEMQPVIDKLLQRAPEMLRLQQWLDNGDLPLRITHNDTKINNVLFDADDQILCIIDLDTVMPGTVLFDFGDAIRTLGNTAPEDEPQLDRIAFNKEYFKAFAEGYLSESREFLTSMERNNLSFSCQYMVWEQSVRFLTDYLNGDTYYKTAYPGHNKVRTLAQVRYLEVMDQNIEFMEQVTSGR